MDQRRTAVALPGGLGGPYTPLLMFACDAAEHRGAEIHHVWWQGDPLRVPREEHGRFVVEQVEPVLAGLRRPLLVAKSLGTHATPLAATYDLPAVWLTPLIATSPSVVDGLRKATAPCLLVGGTADRSWDGDLARELSPHVFEVEGADHGLYVPGPLARSAAVLGDMATAVEQFLDEVVWPG